jgi:hypothetical protein
MRGTSITIFMKEGRRGSLEEIGQEMRHNKG